MGTKILLFILFGLKSVFSANILAILPTPVPSHRNSFEAVLNSLATHHKITYFGPELNKYNSNITQRNLQIEDYLTKFSQAIFQSACETSSFHIVLDRLLNLNQTFFNDMFIGSDFQQLLKSNDKYDLMITIGHSAEHFFQLSHKFNMPIVQIATSIQLPWSNDAIGNPNFFATDISFLASEISDNFLDRFKKFMKHIFVMAHYKWRYMPMINSVTSSHFPPGTPSVEESAKRTALLLVNSQSAMGYSRANVPNVIEIGGLHCTTAKPLPANIEAFMQASGDHGVIYFSLGGTVKGSELPESIRVAILNVFRKLPQNVLWKWESIMKDLPPNVMTSKWIPQQDVLGHKRIKLFITQGGMLSVQEAVFHGVPLLTMPLILDQHTNAFVVEKNGYGLTMDFCSFSEITFLENIRELVQNPKYARRAKEVSLTMRDQDRTPAEKVRWWINYVLRHKGTSTLRPLTNDLSWIQLSEFDIYFTISFCLLALCYLTFSLLRLVNKFQIRWKKLKTS